MIKIKLERRIIESRLISSIYSLISVILALIISGFILEIQGINPIYAYSIILNQVFGTLTGISESIVKAIPLILCGAGLTLAFKAKIWNIGAEGQLLLGAIAATGIALYLGEIPPYIIIPLIFIGGFIAGAIWALIPAILKAYFNINEVIVTTMMNYIAIELVRYLIYGPWRGAKEWGYPITDEIPNTAKLLYIPGTRIHIQTLIIALISVIIIYVIMTRTVFGYEIKVVGENPDAAKYAGINSAKIMVLVMIISGGLAGIAGVGEIAGIHFRLRYPESISLGYGFTAIIVAWLAKLNPIGVILTAFFFGGLLVGGHAMKMMLGLPVAVVNIFNGTTLICLLASELITKYKVKITLKGK